MNKSELIGAIAERTGVTKKDAESVVDGFTEAVTEELQNGGKVKITGFGTFETRDRAARVGRNPQTGEEIDIPATTVPAFKPGSKLKESVR